MKLRTQNKTYALSLPELLTFIGMLRINQYELKSKMKRKQKIETFEYCFSRLSKTFTVPIVNHIFFF